MHRALPAPLAVLLELYLALDFLLILTRPVVGMLALLAREFDETVL